jgi:Fur family ferric uptake transcriptional regulator
VKISYQDLIKDIKKILKQEGQNYTYQREIIIKTLYQSKEHYTPEELHMKIKLLYPKIKMGIATIYRTLNLLEEHQKVDSISFGNGGKKFELNFNGHHDHMICDECGDIIEFCDETIEELQSKIAKKYGFKIKSHTMQLHGICSKCNQTKKDKN